MEWSEEDDTSRNYYSNGHLDVRPDAYGVTLGRWGVRPFQEARIFYEEIPFIIERLKKVYNARNASGPEKL